MTEREKVLNDLQELCEYLFHEYKVCYKGDEEDTYNRFLAANNALNLLKEQPQWISVEDRMPPELHSMWFPLYGTSKWKSAMWREESDHVLVTVVFDDGTRYVSMGRTHDGEWNTNISKVVHHTVTHWMPLPEPPEEVTQDG